MQTLIILRTFSNHDFPGRCTKVLLIYSILGIGIDWRAVLSVDVFLTCSLSALFLTLIWAFFPKSLVMQFKEMKLLDYCLFPVKETAKLLLEPECRGY